MNETKGALAIYLDAPARTNASGPSRSTNYTIPSMPTVPEPTALTGAPGEPPSLDAVSTGAPSERDGVVTIRTSEKNWLARLTQAYRQHAEVDLIDDAGAGIDPARQSLLQMGLAGKLTRREWTAVSLSAGLTLFGAGLIVAAILDPEPTSKLGLLVGSGALLALTGGFQTIGLLIRQRPPSITISAKAIHIDWH